MRAELARIAPTLRRYLFGLCGEWSLAEDVTQDTMLRAWQKRDRFAGRSSVKTWVFTIARHCWLDRLRRRQNMHREEPMPDESSAIADTPPPPILAARAELGRAIQSALADLPAEQRDALALRESEGMTFAEIAELLDLPVATVKSRVRYALLKLAKELKSFDTRA